MGFLNIQLTEEQLVDGVKKAVASFVQDYKSFTAWEITDTLRKEVGPHVIISHNEVRDLVHDLMLSFVAEDYYEVDSNWQVPNSSLTAKFYTPTELWTVTNVVPQLQLNAVPAPLLKVVIPNIRVNSTLVRGISYDGTIKEGTLTVKLDAGDYEYANVPFSIYLEFIDPNTSKGKFFNSVIRGQFNRIGKD